MRRKKEKFVLEPKHSKYSNDDYRSCLYTGNWMSGWLQYVTQYSKTHSCDIYEVRKNIATYTTRIGEMNYSLY